MKLLRKSIGCIILLMFIFLVLSNLKVYGSSVNLSSETFTLSFYCENTDISLNGIEVEVNDSIPVYDDNGEILQFNNFYTNTYTLQSENFLTFVRTSDYMYITIDLTTIPIGYGVNKKGQFITKNQNSYEFELYLIDDVDISINFDKKVTVDILSNDNKKLFADYRMNIIDYDIDINNLYDQVIFDYQVVVILYNVEYTFEGVYDLSNFTFEEKIKFLCEQGLINEQEINNYILSNEIQPYGVLFAELEYTPSYGDNAASIRNDGSRFIIYYDGSSTGMDEDVAQRVADAIDTIDNFFCSSDSHDFVRPNTNSDGEFKIYLETATNMSGSLGSHQPGTRWTLFSGTQRYSYIKLNYTLADATIDTDATDNSFINTLAHEYFHAIMYKEGFSSSDSTRSGWMSESFATFVGLYYANENLSSADAYIKSIFDTRVENFIDSTEESLDDYSSSSNRRYWTFLFPLYLYQNYGFDVIKEIVLEYPNSEDPFIAIDTVLNNYGTNIEATFLDFSLDNGYPYEKYTILYDNYTVDWNRSGEDITARDLYYTPSSGSGTFNLPYFSSEYIYLKPEECTSYTAYITADFDNIDSIDLSTIRKTADDTYYYYSWNISSESITIPQHNFGYHACTELMLVFTNYSSNTSNSVNIDYDITFEHSIDTVEEGNSIDIGQHIHNPFYTNYVKFMPTETDLYQIELNIERSGSLYYYADTFQILDSNKQLIQKYQVNDYQNNASNVYGSNKITVYLLEGTTYYIKTKYKYTFTSINLIINRMSNNISLTTNDDLCTENGLYLGDHFVKLVAPRNGYYNINFEYNGTSSNQIAYNIFYKMSGSMYNRESKLINCTDKISNKELFLSKGAVLYIGYFNGDGVGNVTLTINRVVTQNIAMITDVNENVTVGSEVTLNGGAYQGITLTQGYTRCVYFTDMAPSTSRLDYYWYSLDETKALVSNYGTITAISAGEVKIIAVYKGDSKKVGSLTINIDTDLTGIQKNVLLTTDKRELPNSFGTEVSVMNGIPGETTIHSGYTRFICFASGNPTSNIQDFMWTSSNNNIAIVSSFGTITARYVKGFVTITGVYKYNSNFIATIIIEVI